MISCIRCLGDKETAEEYSVKCSKVMSRLMSLF